MTNLRSLMIAGLFAAQPLRCQAWQAPLPDMPPAVSTCARGPVPNIAGSWRSPPVLPLTSIAARVGAR